MLSALSRAALALLLLAGPFAGAAEAAPRYTVCSATINSSEEIETFRAKLDPDDFEFVELLDYADASPGRDGGWLDAACEAGVQCDVLIVSGHYAGVFFGESGRSLAPDDLERASCRRTCDGILRKPKEVFLMGCNTLATKARDSRTVDEYLDVLLEDGFDRRTAEQVIAARYTPWGPSFETRMRNIFAGVPRIYGFDSLSPSGRNVRPVLRRYLDGVRDYAAHLDTLSAAADDTAERGAAAARALGIVNRALGREMRVTSFTQTSGVGVAEEDWAARENFCAFDDTELTDAEKIRRARTLLEGEDWTDYLPSVSRYLADNEHVFIEPAFADIRADVGESAEIRTRLGGIVTALDGRPALQIEALQLLRGFEWISPESYAAQVEASLEELLSSLSTENARLFCNYATNPRTQIFRVPPRAVDADDFDPRDLASPAMARVTPCIDTDDERITAAMLTIDASRLSQTARAWLIYGLGFAPGMDEEVAAYVRANAPTAPRYRWLLHHALMRKLGPEEAGAWAAAALAEGDDTVLRFLAERVERDGEMSPAMADAYLGFLRKGLAAAEAGSEAWRMAARLFPSGAGPASERAVDILAGRPPAFRGAFYRYLRFNPGETPPALVDLAISDLGHAGVEPHWPAYILAAGPRLDADQSNRLYRLYRDLDVKRDAYARAYVRGLLKTRGDAKVLRKRDFILKDGEAWVFRCLFEGEGADCGVDRV